MPLLTVGHGPQDQGALGARLTAAGVQRLVDVRRFPGSRNNPDVARPALEEWLPPLGIGYRWDERLGGRRGRPSDSPDTALRDRSFAGYAAHMRTPEFTDAVAELLAAGQPTAILCSESVWWRCHRRLVADHVLLVREVPVRHLMHDGRTPEHHPTDGVRRAGDELVYDDGQEPLPGTG
jgi:uncharacterized protein (DUF488 family)